MSEKEAAVSATKKNKKLYMSDYVRENTDIQKNKKIVLGMYSSKKQSEISLKENDIDEEVRKMSGKIYLICAEFS